MPAAAGSVWGAPGGHTEMRPTITGRPRRNDDRQSAIPRGRGGPESPGPSREYAVVPLVLQVAATEPGLPPSPRQCVRSRTVPAGRRKPPASLGAATLAGPYHPPLVVIDDYRQVVMPLAIAELVNADAPQPREPLRVHPHAAMPARHAPQRIPQPRWLAPPREMTPLPQRSPVVARRPAAARPTPRPPPRSPGSRSGEAIRRQ